mmetsp:Transcript_17918/g.27717  ORF Transcript_17918/g.27717 Transcript_17918/m.27717 type:complete len:102 (+) Transcript_17918:593-898(+)
MGDSMFKVCHALPEDLEKEITLGPNSRLQYKFKQSPSLRGLGVRKMVLAEDRPAYSTEEDMAAVLTEAETDAQAIFYMEVGHDETCPKIGYKVPQSLNLVY